MATNKPVHRDKDYISPNASPEEHCLHKLNIGIRDNPDALLAAARDFAVAYDTAGTLKRKFFSLTDDFKSFADQTRKLTGIPFAESMLQAACGHNREISEKLAYDFQPAGRLMVPISEELRLGAQYHRTLSVFGRAAAGRAFAETVIKRHQAKEIAAIPDNRYS